MKKTILGLLISVMLVMSASLVMAAKPTSFDSNGVEKGWEKTECTRIQDGGLLDSAGNHISVGYDEFGYNYQAHMFNGRYCDYDRVIDGDYCDVNLIMKWSDTWLANTDCNNDSKLDRGYSCDSENASSSACEGAWLTNHQSGTNPDGTKWTYFVKIVYPSGGVVDVNPVDGIDDNTGGLIIWGSYVRIQQISNDPSVPEHGNVFSVTPAGFGYYFEVDAPIPQPTEPTIEPTSGYVGDAFTLVDPQGRMQQGDLAVFYIEATDPAAGSPATDVTISADNTTLTGKVPGDLGRGSYFVSVRPTQTADSRFGDLQFQVQ